MAALLRHRVATAERSELDYAEIDGFEQTAAEVAAAMNLSPMGASYVVSYAEALDTRLPRIATLPAQGRTDWRTVRLIIGRTDLVTKEQGIARLDHSLAERIGNWHGWSRQRIVNAVDAAVRTADPDAARERRPNAEDDRCIGISAAVNGMAEIHGSVAASALMRETRRYGPQIISTWAITWSFMTRVTRPVMRLRALTWAARLGSGWSASSVASRARSVPSTTDRPPDRVAESRPASTQRRTVSSLTPNRSAASAIR